MFVNVFANNTTQPQGGGFDFMTLALFVIFGLLIFMMFRKQKKVRTQMEEKAQSMKERMHPGTQVMTQFGLFGTVASVDRDENKVVLELSPGNTATVHLQAVSEIIEPQDAVVPQETVVPNDASALTGDDQRSAFREDESADEALKRLNEEQNKDNK
ncbi:preprotein translocase subunit YajC [Arthrobacter crystallopoietes BAB-32]|uniref:Preprotein translocase subunit YajC n=1 Tax=Arthrobacter crystallopoietes BAB-32 TaxID=1246476 RepID=N1V335_9MICC|nr:preprotein translocase subunit YajC [Arthrobacter crystallopoietes BAB-32]